jgi:hypothetical protein
VQSCMALFSDAQTDKYRAKMADVKTLRKFLTSLSTFCYKLVGPPVSCCSPVAARKEEK